MWEDDMSVLDRDSVPTHWVLSVRKCSCGQTMYYNNREETFHCMKPTCPLNKTHIKDISETRENIRKIRELRKYNSVLEISQNFKIPIEQVRRILKE